MHNARRKGPSITASKPPRTPNRATADEYARDSPQSLPRSEHCTADKGDGQKQAVRRRLKGQHEDCTRVGNEQANPHHVATCETDRRDYQALVSSQPHAIVHSLHAEQLSPMMCRWPAARRGHRGLCLVLRLERTAARQSCGTPWHSARPCGTYPRQRNAREIFKIR